MSIPTTIYQQSGTATPTASTPFVVAVGPVYQAAGTRYLINVGYSGPSDLSAQLSFSLDGDLFFQPDEGPSSLNSNFSGVTVTQPSTLPVEYVKLTFSAGTSLSFPFSIQILAS